MAPKIPIENLYYLLCYAWDIPEMHDKVRVEGKMCQSVENLLAMVLLQVCEHLLRRGLRQEYNYQQMEVEGVRGKLNVAETLKSSKLRLGFTVCQVDEMSHNVLTNQIIYSTLLRLTALKGVDGVIVERIHRTLRKFPRMKRVELETHVFDRVHIDRHSCHYGLAMHVCKLIFQSSLPHKEEGDKMDFLDFTQDELKMSLIFEKFLVNFCKRHLNENFTEIHRERIHFQLSPFGMMFEMAEKCLPVMETDVTLANPSKGIKHIMDAKFYGEALVSKFNAHEKVRREHLSQIISYVLNQENGKDECTMNAAGTLVYPTVTEDFDFSYRYKNTGHVIRVVTVNLNQDWRNIEKRMKEIAMMGAIHGN